MQMRQNPFHTQESHFMSDNSMADQIEIREEIDDQQQSLISISDWVQEMTLRLL